MTLLLMVLCLIFLCSQAIARASSQAPGGVSFSQPAAEAVVYDFVEVTVKVKSPTAGNPFTDATLTGSFRREGAEPVGVDGFCDSEDGSIYRIRFMPARPGSYSYSITFRQGDFEKVHQGAFRARGGSRQGPVRVDREHPWHFIREGTGEHYFWNGTTTYWLMGWDDETIRKNIDRLHRSKVNRLRVAISGRVKDGRAWYENVFPTGKFSFLLNPWVAVRPDSVEDPGFDVTRFNVSYWQKWDRMLRHAHRKDMVISVVFYVDGARPGVDPFGKERMGGEDEQRYYRYAAARFAAFPNIMWDIANEYRFFRDDGWAEKMGAFLKERDPYDHLISAHGFGDFRFRQSPWADFAMYQSWDERGGNAFMLQNRKLQEEAGRIIPQVNEEYGYEDHYPVGWGEDREAPARSADNRRRLAWEMYMAGCYQTTGERADTGTGWGPDTGGGWLNGRGDDSMVMLKGYSHIVNFFRRLEWWKMEPRNDLADNKALCLAEPGKQYIVYLPAGGRVTLKLEQGRYRAEWYNPRTGRSQAIGSAEGPAWTSPAAPDQEDWVLLLRQESLRL